MPRGRERLCAGGGPRVELITIDELRQIEAQRRASSLGFQSTEEGSALARAHGVPSIDLDGIEIPSEVLQLVPKQIAVRDALIPINHAGTSLVVAMADPSNMFAIDALSQQTKLSIEVVVASHRGVANAIAKWYLS